MPDTPFPTQQRLTPKGWAMLGLLALIWGGSFAANRAALAEAGVLTTVAFRVAGAAAILWAVILWRRLPVPGGLRSLSAFAVMGILNNVVPFTLIVWGQSHIPSGLAAILNASTAIFTVALAATLFADERLTAAKAVGALIGLAGVVVVMGIGALAAFDLGSLAQLAVLGAAASYALSGVFGRRFVTGMRPEVSAAGMLSVAAAVMVPAALWTEGAPAFDFAPATWAALLYLAAVASALAYLLFFAVLKAAGAGNLSLVTLMIPPVSVALGAVLFGERLAPSAYLGFALLALGLLIIDGRLGHRARRSTEDS